MTTQLEPRGITRRRFIAQTAYLAAPLILPTIAQGANERIRLGVIGTGQRGTAVMRTFLRLGGVEVVAVCDVQQERRETAAAIARQASGAQNGCQAERDFREVLAREDVDAVLIAPQDHWHSVIAVKAAESKKDIYCEKPLGVCVRDCQAIRDAVRRNGVIFQTGTQQRSDRKFRLACELARNGYLGKIHTVNVAAPGPTYKRSYQGPLTPQPVPPGMDYDLYIGPAEMKPYNPGRHAWPDWYLIWDYCTGFIVNWGVHHLDIALWGCPQLGTQPFELTCTADYRNDGFCNNVNGWQAEFVYADGLRMGYSDSGHPHEQGCRFEGDEGWVHVDRDGIEAQPESLLNVTLKPDELQLHESSDHTADFINAVKARQDPVSPVEAGYMASILGMLADIAARLQRKLRWDPAAERFTDDGEANGMLARPMRPPWVV